MTGGNKLFSANKNAMLIDPSCNKILYDYGVLCAKDALALGVKQLETRNFVKNCGKKKNALL